MEFHAVHFNGKYLNQEMAMREFDGIAILVRILKVSEDECKNRNNEKHIKHEESMSFYSYSLPQIQVLIRLSILCV